MLGDKVGLQCARRIACGNLLRFMVAGYKFARLGKRDLALDIALRGRYEIFGRGKAINLLKPYCRLPGICLFARVRIFRAKVL